jgi:hypothetical protein
MSYTTYIMIKRTLDSSSAKAVERTLGEAIGARKAALLADEEANGERSRGSHHSESADHRQVWDHFWCGKDRQPQKTDWGTNRLAVGAVQRLIVCGIISVWRDYWCRLPD